MMQFAHLRHTRTKIHPLKFALCVDKTSQNQNITLKITP